MRQVEQVPESLAAQLKAAAMGSAGHNRGGGAGPGEEVPLCCAGIDRADANLLLIWMQKLRTSGPVQVLHTLNRACPTSERFGLIAYRLVAGLFFFFEPLE